LDIYWSSLGLLLKKERLQMKMRNLFTLRKALKDPKASEKLVGEIKKALETNDKNYKDRDKELNDLLKIISSAQNIINSKSED
jgi:hypothetical protein